MDCEKLEEETSEKTVNLEKFLKESTPSALVDRVNDDGDCDELREE